MSRIINLKNHTISIEGGKIYHEYPPRNGKQYTFVSDVRISDDKAWEEAPLIVRFDRTTLIGFPEYKENSGNLYIISEKDLPYLVESGRPLDDLLIPIGPIKPSHKKGKSNIRRYTYFMRAKAYTTTSPITSK